MVSNGLTKFKETAWSWDGRFTTRTMLGSTLAVSVVCSFVVLALTGRYTATIGRAVLVAPGHAVKHQEELDEEHAALQSEEESEGIYKHWNAAHNDEIRGDNIGEIHPSSAWHHELFSKTKPIKKVRTHAKVSSWISWCGHMYAYAFSWFVGLVLVRGKAVFLCVTSQSTCEQRRMNLLFM